MLRAEIWIATTVISVLIIGGMIYYWPQTATPAPAASAEEEPWRPPERVRTREQFSVEGPSFDDPAEIQEQNGVNPIAPIERGDNYLLVGNYVEAIKQYQRALSQSSDSASAARLLVRLGFSSEQTGFYEQAASYYHKAIRESQSGHNDRMFAVSGLSRVWQAQGRLDESLELLAELFLRNGTDENLPDEIRLQIVYQLATTVQKLYLKSEDHGFGDPLRLEFQWCRPLIEEMLAYESNASSLVEEAETDIEDGTEEDEREPLAGPLAIRLLQRPGDDANLIALDLVSSNQPVTTLFEELGKSTGLKFEFTNAAGTATAGRSLTINVEGMSVAMLLDSCLASFELLWQQDGDTVVVSHSTETPEIVDRSRLSYADRLLRWIELTFPREPRRDSSLMHRGNLSLLAGDGESARLRYNELLELRPNGEISAKLSFNIAKLEIANQRPEFAVDRLFHAIDQTLDFQIQSAGYTWIGRIELEQGNTRNAIYAASRALAITSSTEVAQENTMTLARAYLLQNDPFSANRALFDNVDSISDDRNLRIAGVLGSYARFITTGSSPLHGHERERLLLSLSSITPDEVEGFVDEMLIGRAYFEVGLTLQSGLLLERALSRSGSSIWQEKIAYELAMQRYRSGEEDVAAGIFSEIASESQSREAILAKMMLARIFLERKDAEYCLQICHELWGNGELEEKDKGITLEMMGKAYQLLDQHHSAAVCFSGMVPNYASAPAVPETATEALAPPVTVPFSATQPIQEVSDREVIE